MFEWLKRTVKALPVIRRGYRRDYPGAVPPNRFVVVHWPSGRLVYQGCIGAQARRVYENTPPGSGGEVEIWELGRLRGSKAG